MDGSSSYHPLFGRIRSFVTYEEAFGSSIAYDALVEMVAGLPINYVVRMVSTCLVLADLYGTTAERTQGLTVPKIFPESLPHLGQVQPLAHQRVFIHRPQLLALLRLSLLHGRCRDASVPDDERKEMLGRSLLGLNSFLYPPGTPTEEYRTAGMGPLLNATRTGEWGTLNDEGRAQLMNFVHSYNSAISSDIRKALSRYADMFLADAGSTDPSGHSGQLLQARLTDTIGVDAQEYVSLVFALLAHYIDAASIFSDASSFPIDGRTFFSKSRLSPELVSTFFSHVGADTEQLRAMFQDSGDASSLFEVVPFMTFPFVRLVDSETYWPLGVDPIVELFGSSMFWKAANPGMRFDEALRTHWGELFESYCHSLCRRIGNTAWRGLRVYTSSEYVWRASPKLSCDAVIVQPPMAVLLEFKTKALGLRQSLQDRSYDSFLRDVDELLIGSPQNKAAAQIDSTINCLRSGELELPGTRLDEIRSHAPVVVTLQAWPVGPMVYECIRGRVHTAGLLRQPHCLPLELWGCEDVENLQSIACQMETPIRIADVVRNKASQTYFNIPMRLFISDNFGGQFRPSSHMRAARHAMFSLIEDTLALQV